jgi:hypothetical protein
MSSSCNEPPCVHTTTYYCSNVYWHLFVQIFLKYHPFLLKILSPCVQAAVRILLANHNLCCVHVYIFAARGRHGMRTRSRVHSYDIFFGIVREPSSLGKACQRIRGCGSTVRVRCARPHFFTHSNSSPTAPCAWPYSVDTHVHAHVPAFPRRLCTCV